MLSEGRREEGGLVVQYRQECSSSSSKQAASHGQQHALCSPSPKLNEDVIITSLCFNTTRYIYTYIYIYYQLVSHHNLWKQMYPESIHVSRWPHMQKKRDNLIVFKIKGHEVFNEYTTAPFTGFRNSLYDFPRSWSQQLQWLCGYCWCALLLFF